MQSPGRRRPPLKSIHVPQDADLEAVASRARYIGSPEHKSAPSFAGQPKLRSSASKCPSSLVDPDKLTEWLKRAIKQGNVGSPWEGIFPRYAWFTSDEGTFEARLVNRGLGEYKGYPIGNDELPDELKQ